MNPRIHHNDYPPRYCTNHQGLYPVAGGVWLASGGTRRWICASCRARRSQSILASAKRAA